MVQFDKDGRLIIPITKRGKDKDKDKNAKYVIKKAYCPNGCNIIDVNHPINGFPGLRIKYKRPGVEGELVLSAIEGDFDKIILSGSLEEGVKDELYCPHCGEMFKKLVSCNCKEDADMVIIGLTPHLDFNNAITFCNVTGCHNGSYVKSGDILRHIRLKEGF
ncbi:hypothetical protein JW824_01185 [bacterium]|nr:hypothetical protein [bacterium]